MEGYKEINWFNEKIKELSGSLCKSSFNKCDFELIDKISLEYKTVIPKLTIRVDLEYFNNENISWRITQLDNGKVRSIFNYKNQELINKDIIDRKIEDCHQSFFGYMIRGNVDNDFIHLFNTINLDMDIKLKYIRPYVIFMNKELNNYFLPYLI